MTSALRSALSRLSPRRKRWQRFLESLPLDPGRCPTTIGEPGKNDFIICGASRTGTTLLAAALFQPPQVVTVMEPWDGMKLPPGDLYRSIRRDIRETGQLRTGRLDIPVLREERRVGWCRDGAMPVDVHVDESFALGVKWPTYWRFLEYLPGTKFLVCVRDPIDVVTSFERVGGRLALGLDYDIAFNRDMNNNLLSATVDASIRRILLYEYSVRRQLEYLDRENVMLVRYERWFDEPDRLMSEIGEFIDVELGEMPVDIKAPLNETPSETLVGAIRQFAPSAAELGYVV